MMQNGRIEVKQGKPPVLPSPTAYMGTPSGEIRS